MCHILICWFDAQETFIIFSVVLLYIFMEIVIYIFSGFFDEQKVKKNSFIRNIYIFCNITVTFDQFNASFLNTCINFFLKSLTDLF